MGWWPCASGWVQEVTTGVALVGQWPHTLDQEVTGGMSPVVWWHPKGSRHFSRAESRAMQAGGVSRSFRGL